VINRFSIIPNQDTIPYYDTIEAEKEGCTLAGAPADFGQAAPQITGAAVW